MNPPASELCNNAHQDDPSVALDLMKMTGLTASSAVIDIGAGTSRLMDRLLDLGLSDLSALDLSESALAAARVRLGAREKSINWIVEDITRWEPTQLYDIWHDRAVSNPSSDGRRGVAGATGGDAAWGLNGRVVADLG